MAEKNRNFIRSAAFCRIYTASVTASALAAAGIFLAVTPGNPDNAVSIPWTIAADCFLPLLLLGCAAKFSSRVCAAAAVLAALLEMTLRIGAFAIYRETFMPLSYSTLALLAEHTDHTALCVFFGKHYLWWLIPALAASGAFLWMSARIAWQSDFAGFFREHLPVRLFFAAGLAVALAGNVGYWHTLRLNNGAFYTGISVRPLLFFGAEAVNRTTRALFTGHGDGAPGYFPGKLGDAEKELLHRSGIYRAPAERDRFREKVSRFDRIIIIAVESLDLDFIGAANPAMPSGITPVLDGLFARYPRLVHYYCGGQPTSWGLNSLLASRLDYQRDVQSHRNASLVSVAREKGFDTAYYSSCRGSFGDNRARYKKLFRFDELFFMEDWVKKHPGSTRSEWGITDRDLLHFTIDELKKKKGRKFLAVISTMDTHPLYHSDIPFGNGQDPFLDALHSTDRNLGVFLDAVMRDPDLYDERTLVIVTADHTATHGRNFLKRKKFSPEKIPLVFITPDPAPFLEIPQDAFASSIDFAPTVVHLLGEKIPDTFMGQDLRMPRNAALSRNLDDQLLVRSNGEEKIIHLGAPPPQNPESHALYDYFYSFYER
ncbi:MAG: sulfatase-like hydrolase/transferase [Victivallaceae bacterium]|nr:sulfatase-like hydrolase/transferase [Victivallaceae bacterium]